MEETFSAVPKETPPTRQVRRTFSRAALALALYTIVAYTAQTLLLLLVSAINSAFPGFVTVNNIIYLKMGISFASMYVFGLPVLFLILRGMKRAPIETAPLSWEDGLVIFFISRAFLTVGSLISQIVISAIETISGHTLVNTTEELIEKMPLWLIVLIVVILAPLVEEWIYRKLLIDRVGVFGDKAAILFSAIVFGLGHGNFFQFCYSFLLGLILGYLYTSTGKLRYSIGLHMLTNFLGSVAVLPLLDATKKLEGITEEILEQDPMAAYRLSMPIFAFSIVQYAFAIAGAILFFYYIKKIVFKRQNPLALSKSQFVISSTVNFGVILFFLVTLAEFILSVIDI